MNILYATAQVKVQLDKDRAQENNAQPSTDRYSVCEQGIGRICILKSEQRIPIRTREAVDPKIIDLIEGRHKEMVVLSANVAQLENQNPGIPELGFLRSGKVRDIYEVDEDRMLIVASDRISAFDCILPDAIPRKGEVLTQISRFWFGRFSDFAPNHMLTTEVNEFPAELKERLSEESQGRLHNRAMLVRRAEVIPFECVVRGYLAGSGWKEYQQTGSICGHPLPPGLVESSRLPTPIFTPATKAEEGHDSNISIDEMTRAAGLDLTRRLEALSLEIYAQAVRYAESRGIIICDTKFEFGLRKGELILVDEILTPDSSRFWPAASYTSGRPQPSFDKQFVRDFLETLDWDKRPPAPALPPDIIAATSAKYLEAFRLITGRELA